MVEALYTYSKPKTSGASERETSVDESQRLPHSRRSPFSNLLTGSQSPMAISKSALKSPLHVNGDHEHHGHRHHHPAQHHHQHRSHHHQQRSHSHSLLLHHHGVVMPSEQHAHLARCASVKLLVKNGLSREAAEVKQRVLAACPDSLVRFSFSCMRRVVTPPVAIPQCLASARATTMVVAGKRVPMTRAMWERRKKQLARRLPDRVDEQLSW